MVTVSVPGKVHMMGEHAVVYGTPALLAAINMRMRVSIAPKKSSEAGRDSIEIRSKEETGHARYAVNFLLEKLKIETPEVAVLTIDSDIPAGYHLGSSAALAVGIAGAILYFYKKIWNPIRINELAYEIEKKQHGNPSGGDNTAVSMGGIIWYRKELEFLKSIWQFPFTPHGSLAHFFLINTGKPVETTGEMVARVKKLVNEDSGRLRQLFYLNELQVKRIAVALKEGNEPELMNAMRTGEKTLEGMGVVSAKVVPFLREIEKNGGAVKIFGGGGYKGSVGFLLCYHRDEKKIERLAAARGYSVQHIVLGEEGVRLDEK